MTWYNDGHPHIEELCDQLLSATRPRRVERAVNVGHKEKFING